MQGGSIGTLLCYTFVIIVSIYVLIKETGIVPDFKVAVLKPLGAAAICIAASWLTYSALARVVPENTKGLLVATITAVIVACVVYAIFLLIMRAITKEDILMLPKGNKIAGVLEKYHFIK